MVRQPLQSGVGEHQVEGFMGAIMGAIHPLADFRSHPGAFRLRLARGVDHFRRTVQTGNVRAGPSLGQDGGAVAGAAAQVDRAVNAWKYDSRHQVAAGLRPFIRETKILAGVPTGHTAIMKPINGFKQVSLRP